MHFHEIRYLIISRKSAVIIQLPSESDKNNRYFKKDQYTFLIIFRSAPLRMKNMSDKFVDKIIKKYLIYNIYIFFENRAVYG